MATSAEYFINPINFVPNEEKDSSCLDAVTPYLDYLLKKAKYALRSRGIEIVTEANLGIAGFISDTTSGRLIPLFTYDTDEVCFCFRIDAANRRDIYYWKEEENGFGIKRMSAEGKIVNSEGLFAELDEKELAKTLKWLKGQEDSSQLNGFIPLTFISDYFLADEESLPKRIEKLKELKLILANASPSAYDAVCAKHFSVIK